MPATGGKNLLWPLLAGLRFFLALVVCGSHLSGIAESPWWKISQLFSGFGAVLGFLIVSGFSIAASLAKDETHFYFRRGLRILPLYIPTVLLSAALPHFIPFAQFKLSPEVQVDPIGRVILNLFFGQGFVVQPVSANSPLWTISLEVFFYAIAPWLNRRANRTLMAMILASGIGYIAIRHAFLPHYYLFLHGLNVIFLGWSWLLGFWLFRQKDRAMGGLVALAVAGALTTLNAHFLGEWSFLLLVLTVAAIELGERSSGPLWLSNLLNFMGNISYPLYLLHLPVYYLLLSAHAPARASLYIFCALAVAALACWLIENPIKRIIGRSRTS